MTIQFVAALAVIAALYVEAGRRTFQVLVLTHRGDNPMFLAARENRLPKAAYLAWYVAWVPLMLLGWIAAQVTATGVRPSTNP